MSIDSKADVFTFDGLANLFVTLGALNSPAELHGMLCGQLCGGNRFSEAQWLSVASDFLEPTMPLDAEANQLLGDFYHITLEQLGDEEFGVELLLPDDDSDLGTRITGLGQWCHGFLSGFGGSGITGDTQLSAETSDVLRDFAAFVQLDPQDAEDDESETDYMEIVEYVRVATLTIFMEIGIGENDGETKTPTLH